MDNQTTQTTYGTTATPLSGGAGTMTDQNTVPADQTGQSTTTNYTSSTATSSPTQATHSKYASSNTKKTSTTQSTGVSGNKKTVIGAFDSYPNAENAFHQLEQQGLSRSDLSIVAKNHEVVGAHGGQKMDGVGNGLGWGAGIGATAGLLVGAGALAVPGLGPIVAVGPIAGALAGAATGGVAGVLVDLGIPGNASKHYEKDVKEGKTLLVAQIGDEKTLDIAKAMKQAGGHDVEIH